MEQLSSKTIIICSIVRNAENGLTKNIPVIDNLCNYFKDYNIVVYENDSKDQTKDILRNWQKQAPNKIHISINDVDAGNTIPQAYEVKANPFFSKKRIGKMVNLRKELMI